MIITCQICGNNFEAKRSNGKNCSDECRKEYRRLRMQKLRASDPELLRQRYNSWYERQGVKYHKRWRDAHPEYREAANKRAIEYKKVDGRKKRYDAAYYQRHKEQIKADVKVYTQENRDKLRPAKHAALIRYRARKANAEGNWTTKQFKELCEAVDYHCAYCHEKFDKLTADHIVPLFRDGSNDISNIIPACRSCNAAKGATTPLEFLSPFNIL